MTFKLRGYLFFNPDERRVVRMVDQHGAHPALPSLTKRFALRTIGLATQYGLHLLP